MHLTSLKDKNFILSCFGIVQGSPSGLDLECKSESHLLLDGVAVRWGPHHKVESAAQCCQACREHIPSPHIGGPYAELPCNAWAYCPEEVCFDVDAHRHTQGVR